VTSSRERVPAHEQPSRRRRQQRLARKFANAAPPRHAIDRKRVRTPQRSRLMSGQATHGEIERLEFNSIGDYGSVRMQCNGDSGLCRLVRQPVPSQSFGFMSFSVQSIATSIECFDFRRLRSSCSGSAHLDRSRATCMHQHLMCNKCIELSSRNARHPTNAHCTARRGLPTVLRRYRNWIELSLHLR
jgi:hypothetical protein